MEIPKTIETILEKEISGSINSSEEIKYLYYEAKRIAKEIMGEYI